MADPGIGLDQGGNPLQEGIWAQTDGGWQPYRRRDESFASTMKTAAVTVTPPTPGGIHNGPLALLQQLRSVSIDGIPVTPENSPELFMKYGMQSSPHFGQPVTVTAHHPEFENFAADIIQQGHGNRKVHQPDAERLMGLVRSGQVPPPTPPGTVASKVSFEDFDFGIDFDRTPKKKFVVTRNGDVLTGPAEGTHEDIAQTHGLHDFPKGYSLGQLNDDNSTEWYQHETGHSPQGLESMLYGTFGHPVIVDPELKPTTNEERWGVQPGQDVWGTGNRELDVLQGAPRPRSYGVPLDRNEGLVRGGSLNMEPYMPWTHEAGIEKEAFLPALLGLLGLAGGEAAAGGAAAGLAGAELAGGGAAAGLAGGGGAILPGLMRGALMGTGSNMVKGLGGGQPQPGPASVPPPPPVEALSHVTADYETPSSNPGFTESEDGDPHQFNDLDHDPNPENPNLPGGAGGSASGEDNVDGGIGPNQPTFSPGTIENAKLLLPNILNYYNSPESGVTDPQIKALHEQLESENPGYLDNADDGAVEALIQKLREPSAVAASYVTSAFKSAFDWNMAPDTADVRPQGINGQQPCAYCGGQPGPDGTCSTCGAKSPTNPQAIQQQQGVPQQSVAPPGFAGQQAFSAIQQGQCHHCGAVTDASGRCPQCGAVSPSIEGGGALAPNIQATAADHQGPVTPEQQQAVAQLLIDQGRHEEIPGMIAEPWNYAKELAEVVGDPNVTPNVDPSEQPPPQPVQEVAPPGATMPVPSPAAPQMQPMARAAADTLAERCPKCGSGTTGLLGEDGQCHCHACGNVWSGHDLVEKKASPEHPEGENVVGAPAADQQEQYNPDADQDSSHTWQDDSGQPLTPGQTYELHSPKYQIPDIVRVEEVKPDSLVVTTIGEENPDPNGQDFGYKHEINREEAELEGYTFQVGDQSPEPTPEQAQGDGTPAPVNTEPQQVPDIPRNVSSVQSSEEQPDPDEYCPKCASQHISSTMSSPTTSFHECFRCGNAWETKEEDYRDEHTASRDWLMNDSGPGGDDFFAEMERHRAMREAGHGSRSLSDIAAKDSRLQEIRERLEANAQEHTAGRKFTPSEQREFIDEQGVARNADKLDLGGTHYESHRYLGDRANGLNAPDEHLFLGL